MFDNYHTLTYTYHDKKYFVLYGENRMSFDRYDQAIEFNELFLEVVTLETLN